MTTINKKTLNLFLAFTLLLSLVLPSISFAEIAHQDTGSLTIHKFEREPGATPEGQTQTGPKAGVPADAKGLAGVTYKIIQTHAFDGNNWTEVTNGETREVTTGQNGIVKVENLPVGRYTVQETDGPDNVILNTKVFSVDIPMTYNDGKDLAYDVNIYPKNETIRGAVELTKVNEAGEAIEGVKFQLYKADGTKEGGVLTANASGKISAEGLAAGDYYFKEVSTVGNYAKNETEIPFTVKKDQDGTDGKVLVEWTEIDGFAKVDANNPNNINVTNYNQPDVVKDVEGDMDKIDRDTEFKYNISITTPEDIKKYKKLIVTDTLDDRLTFVTNGSLADGWNVTGTDKDNIEFSVDGQTLTWSVKDFSQLTAGTDLVITFTAKIKPDAELDNIDNKANIAFDNDRGEDSEKEDTVIVTPKDGGMKVVKVDKANNDIKLKGAQFKLTTDKAGNNVVNAAGKTIKVNGSAVSGNLENLTTNDSGEILITGLTPGTYYLHETKAPTYQDDGVEKSYRLLTKPVEVEVVDSTENKEVTVENSKSGWELPTTGGIGTILFTLVGLALMAFALVAYLRRRKAA